jgi:hypothetical protein
LILVLWRLLRLKVRVCRDACVESMAIANTGFIGLEPEILIPQSILESMVSSSVTLDVVERVLADGTRVTLRRMVEPVDVMVVEDDRVVGPVKARAIVSRRGPLILNDRLLDELKIVILSPGRGLWCFIDEINVRVRRSY